MQKHSGKHPFEQKKPGWWSEVHSVVSRRKPGFSLSDVVPRRSSHFLPAASPSAGQHSVHHCQNLERNEEV